LITKGLEKIDGVEVKEMFYLILIL